ncbi:MAG: XRE family transcriptional regulator [Bryobacteraceae bacterium]
MGVEDLLNKILETIRARIRNGEFTERALARRMAVSQAHMHNVLKGVRSLTPPLADRLTAELGISLTALIGHGTGDGA